jgi:hypothetical protein
MNQGGAQEEKNKEEEVPQAPPTQVWATIQRNHPVDQIIGAIGKGVTTLSRLVNLCERYSFVSSIEPFRGMSGTIIRGTLKTPNSQLVTPISIKLQRPDGCD